MTIQFAIVDKNINTKNFQEIKNNIQANAIFETNMYINETAFDIINRIVKNILIKDKKLNHNTKLIRRILKHNTTTEPTQQELFNIENTLKEFQYVVENKTQTDQPNMNWLKCNMN